jgi:hypothetical protein
MDFGLFSEHNSIANKPGDGRIGVEREKVLTTAKEG